MATETMAFRGLDELRGAIATLRDRTAKKAAKAGVNAGLQALVRAERAAVNAAPVSPELKAAARKTLAKRLRRQEGQDWTGKAGFAVAASKAQRQKSRTLAHARNLRGQGRSNELRGVGLSVSDIHWFVLGTKPRETKAGHRTGELQPLLAGVISSAAAGAGPAMLEAARERITKVLASDASQLRKG